MFESALITKAEAGTEIDLGLIAETVFFYRSTHLLLNIGSLESLAKSLSPDDLLAFFDRTGIKLTYLRPNYAVVSGGAPRTAQFVAVTFGGRAERKVKNHKEEIAFRLERALGSSRATAKLVKQINDRVSLHKFTESNKEDVVPQLSRQDAADKSFIREGVKSIINHLVPEYQIPSHFRFDLIDTGQGYAVDTDIDYTAINARYHQSVSPAHSTISSDYILAHFIGARADSYFAATYMSEIVTSALNSALIRLKHFDFLHRRGLNEEQLQLFLDTIVGDVPRLSEAINSRDRTISDFLRLLDQADKFRSWLGNINPNEGLLRSYMRAATEQTWADKIPTKSVRFAISTGLGMLADAMFPTGIGTAAGLSVGAADSLYIDRIIKGWRPNQFIEGAYAPFVSGNSKRRAD
ncbi:hypothetical protein [Bradyrhizobium oligotrophicum]|uniref:hypothetical protein n=1 Tax=Bradyrhizobium oligotrophicum TaxID=44255 RepID=UPI003EBBEA10